MLEDLLVLHLANHPPKNTREALKELLSHESVYLTPDGKVEITKTGRERLKLRM